jgi:hypothetical protein
MIEDLHVTNGAVVVKYDPNGNQLWARGNVGEPNYPRIAVDPIGNVFLAGDFAVKLSFGSTNLESNIAPDDVSRDIYLAKYCSCGQLLWVTQSDGNAAEYLRSIAVDGSGNCLLVGSYKGALAFGDSVLKGSPTNQCTFAAKYDLNGTVLWAQKIDEQSRSAFTWIAADAAGNSYVAHDRADAPLSISKRNSGGYRLWTKHCPGLSKVLLKVDSAGHGYAVGDFSEPTITLDQFTLTNAADPESKTDKFLAMLDIACAPWESPLKPVAPSNPNPPARTGVFYSGPATGFRGPASATSDDVLNQNDPFNTLIFPVSSGRMLFELKPRY